MSQLIFEPFRCFTYITVYSPTLLSLLLRHRLFPYVARRAHSPTFPSLHLRHSSFSNPSLALPMSQLIFEPFCCFTYITDHSPTIPSLFIYVTAHSPTLPLLHLCHSSFSNPSFASPTSQDFHLRHLASRP